MKKNVPGYVCSKKATKAGMLHGELLKVDPSGPRDGGAVGVNILRVGFVRRRGLVKRGSLEGTGMLGQ